jgi:peptidoglycan hydrolase-like protein with peptidoglycan-binding domain
MLRGKHAAPATRLPRTPSTTRSAYSPGRLARSLALLGAAGAVAALTLPLGADAATIRHPVTHVRLPATAEAPEPYVPQDSCDPVAKPGVIAFRALMLATYHRGTDGGIVRACADGATSEHKEGRAWDWMLNSHNPSEAATASAVLSWLTGPGPHGELGWNARRFGIMYIIWNGHIWGAYRASDGWRPYVGVSEHTDHIHFSFGWNGALKRTSWWTGKVAPVDYGPCPVGSAVAAPRYHGFNPTPCPGSGDTPLGGLSVYAGPWQSGAHVLAVQRALDIQPQSGLYGPMTAHAVALWQLHHHLRHTGIVDLATARAMRLVVMPGVPYAGPGNTGPHVLALQRALHVHPVSGHYGAATAHAVALWQLHHHLRHTGIVDLATARAMHLVAPAPGPVYAGPGSRGPHVLAVQHALGFRPASGYYGPMTAHAVALWQLHHHLRHTGIVDAATARAMHLH